MMMKRFSLSKKGLVQASIAAIAAFLLAAILSLALHTSPAAAQSSTTANTLRVSPVRSDVQVRPGQNQKIQMLVSNNTTSPVTVRPVVNDFVSGDENGTPALVLDENVTLTRSLKRFIGPLSNVTIPARQTVAVEVSVIIPQDAVAGGYFGAVRFAPVSPDGGGQVNLSASVASIILLTIPGDVTERMELTNFAVQQDGKQGTNFRTGENLEATFRFENKGGLQAGPFGTIAVKNGDTVVYETAFNDKEPRDMVLPDGARRWNVPLENIDGFGYYTVQATFTYGQTNQTIEATQSFWVIPWFVIIAAIVGLVVLVGVIVGIILLVKARRRRNARRPGGMRISKRRR